MAKRILTVKEMAKMGGTARMAALTPKQRSELGRMAVLIRWNKAKGKKTEK
jgi:hypothetical protein